MQITLNIDLSNHNALALINFIKGLDFIKIEEGHVNLSEYEKKELDLGLHAVKSGRVIEHSQLVSDLKNQFPNLFK